jgi:hypothetical protein
MDTSAQRFNLSMQSSKPDGDEQVSMALEIDTSCSLNFMSNAFVQLMANDEKIRTAILMAATYELLGDIVNTDKPNDYGDIDEIINKVINKK